MRGLCRQGLAPQLQPPPLVRNVSPVLSDHCSLLDYYVKFPDFKILITDSNEGGGEATGQIKHIRDLDSSAIEERAVSASWPVDRLHNLAKVCLLLCRAKDVGRGPSKSLLA